MASVWQVIFQKKVKYVDFLSRCLQILTVETRLYSGFQENGNIKKSQVEK